MDHGETDIAVNNPELNDFLYRQSLASPVEQVVWTKLAGGVSSDIWRVDLPDRTICVKRALAQLKVAAEWLAPITRNKSEWDWIQFVNREFPGLVPQPIAHDEELQMLAMQYLPPAEFPVWKSLLLQGVVDHDFATLTGQTLARIHAKSAVSPETRELFRTDETFHSLRLEPYLLATAERHPALRETITETTDRTARTHLALVHGDVSPKNILVSARGPIFLDAECAWFGDPAFDLAFCLNHFLLKCLVRPDVIAQLMMSFAVFCESYLGEVGWEAPDELESRCARLLPILFLARVDGKSPVEYVTREIDKDLVRETAYFFITHPTQKLLPISLHWQAVVSGRTHDV
jgi:fructosamine-3-kinase